jgi:uncharacterized repeat protein (TIGR03806 family)
MSLWGQSQALGERVAATTLRLPSNPIRYSYALTNAFGDLTFTNPVVITTPPGETNRIFVVEQGGQIAVITNLAAPTRTVFLDLMGRVAGGVPGDERGLLGLAFHPGYATNGFFFIYYSQSNLTAAGIGPHQQLSRFRVSSTNENAADADSEAPVLTMFDEAANHNGGDLHFGPDGLLYAALGDEGAGNDALLNSQRIDKDFWASMLRLDVDEPYRADSLMPNPHPANTNNAEGVINYRVPADNPFVGATSFLGSPVIPDAVRTEIYAVGLRNPWRFSFDPVTGFLYCGDVGQGAWEEIDVIVKGGNYGWAFREGNIVGPRPAPPGFSSQPPILAYSHGGGIDQGFSVTGGVVYRGQQNPALHGAYLFADYVSGNLWSLFSNGSNSSGFKRLLVDGGIAGFGVDPSNGDVLTADQSEDTIKRLVPVASAGQPFPETLAETGAFSDLATLTPSPGLAPYELNTPFWSDAAIKTRWFYIPTNFTLVFQTQTPWLFPTGSVWVKHFELEMTNGVAESRRRLETRFLVRYQSTDQTEAYGVTYRWDESGTNATLVPDEGLDETLLVDDGAGVIRPQVWHYPGRGECLQCHTRLGGLALGFHTAQLNREVDYGDVTENQLLAMSHAGYFLRPLTNQFTLRAMARLDDESISVEQRVRSYLSANCVQCHVTGGIGLGTFDTRFAATLTGTRLVNGTLVNNGGNPNARVVVPGSPDLSMLLQRISTRGPGQMPPLASSVVDTQAVALVRRWITTDLTNYQSFAQWQLANFGSTTAPESFFASDPDADGASNFTEYLTRTEPTNHASAWGIGLSRQGSQLEIFYPRLANRRIEIQWSTNLTNPGAWQFLHVPENRPFISATNGETRLPDSLTEGPGRFYRARVFEP